MNNEMTGYDAYRCPYCGGHVDPVSLKCSYCGTRYYKNNNSDNLIRIETYQNPIRTYGASIELNKHEYDIMGKEDASKMAIDMLSHKLADALAENMELDTEFDPSRMCQKISARVRIIEPKYMF